VDGDLDRIARFFTSGEKFDATSAIARQVQGYRIGRFERNAISNVVYILLQDPDSVANLRANQPLDDWPQNTMQAMTDAWLRNQNSTEFLDQVLGVIREALASTAPPD